MAHTIELTETGSIGLSEYVDFIDSNVDVRNLESVAESAPYFKALLNNPNILNDAVKRQLRSWRTFQAGNIYSGQTFILGSGRRQQFFVRANLWFPATTPGKIAEWEKNMFAYGIAHDHNFSFMTGGYLGAGYETTIYEYDRSAVRGEIGEAVDLHLSETTQLTPGKVMLFREAVDVHVQDFPGEMSVSINLMLPAVGTKPQLFFDLKASRLCRPEVGTQDAGPFICELADLFGDEESRALAREVYSNR